MANNINNPEESDFEQGSTPMTLSIRDVVFIIVAVTSMVTAWGLFGTRLSIVEEKIIFISKNISEIRDIVKDLKDDEKDQDELMRLKLESLEGRLRNVETNQAELKVLLIKKRK